MFDERRVAKHDYRAALLVVDHAEALFLANAHHAKGDEEGAAKEIERAQSYRDELARLLAAHSRMVER